MSTARALALSTLIALAPASAQDAVDAAPAHPLANAASPLLERHVDDAFRWHPWGAEAIERARREDKLILLSIGYWGCTWCSRMERDTYEDAELAQRFADELVCIAVDRDELPVVGTVYQTALQAITNTAGWPVTAFVDPRTLGVVYVSSYIPPEDLVELDLPGFATVLDGVLENWRDARDPMLQYAQGIVGALPELVGPRGLGRGLSRGLGRDTLEQLLGENDPIGGGFFREPKFPGVHRLELMLTSAAEDEAVEAALRHALFAIVRGNLQDHLAGGFFRSCGAADWTRPDFQRTLVVEATLGSLLVRAGRSLEEPELVRAGERSLDHALGHFVDPTTGRFYAADDSETDGVLGGTYTWTREEVEAVVGEEWAGLAARLLGLDGPPNWSDPGSTVDASRWVPRRPAPLPGGVLPREQEIDPSQRAEILGALLEARARRVQPEIDRTTYADVTGLAAAELARAGTAHGRSDWVEAAERGLAVALDLLRDGDGRLHHSWHDGRRGPIAIAPDHALLVRGALELHSATDDDAWLALAVALHDEGHERFAHPEGGWYDGAADDHPFLPAIPASVRDAESTSTNGELLANLVDLARRTEEPRFLDQARETATAHAATITAGPTQTPRAVAALKSFEAHFPDAVPRGEGVVVRARDAQVTYELRPAPDHDPSTGFLSLTLTLTMADGFQLAAADPVTDGPTGLGIVIVGDTSVTLEVGEVAPDYGRLTVNGAPLATHGDEVVFPIRVGGDLSRLSQTRLRITAEPWSEAGPERARSILLQLNTFFE